MLDSEIFPCYDKSINRTFFRYCNESFRNFLFSERPNMTIKEIAQQLNLSSGTVSKALNNAADISEETKKLVCEYAKKVGYRATKTLGNRIALLYQFMQTNYQNQLFFSISTAFNIAASNSEYEIITDILANKDEKFDLIEYMENNHFAGAFILGVNFDSPIYPQLQNAKHPLVLLDMHIPTNPSISSVGSESMASVQNAIHYLKDMGHTKIGFLSGEQQSFVASERLAAYILSISSIGIVFNTDYIYFGDFTRECGAEAAKHFASTDVTAILCASDMMAIGLIDGLQKQGIKIPDDISVIGFDDLELLKYTQYNLTTIKQDFVKLGETAFIQLRNLIKGKFSKRIIIPCELVKRGTVRDLNEEKNTPPRE